MDQQKESKERRDVIARKERRPFLARLEKRKAEKARPVSVLRLAFSSPEPVDLQAKLKLVTPSTKGSMYKEYQA